MGTYYDEPLIEIINMQLNDVIRTSTGKDPFEDDYQDPKLGCCE